MKLHQRWIILPWEVRGPTGASLRDCYEVIRPSISAINAQIFIQTINGSDFGSFGVWIKSELSVLRWTTGLTSLQQPYYKPPNPLWNISLRTYLLFFLLCRISGSLNKWAVWAFRSIVLDGLGRTHCTNFGWTWLLGWWCYWRWPGPKTRRTQVVNHIKLRTTNHTDTYPCHQIKSSNFLEKWVCHFRKVLHN